MIEKIAVIGAEKKSLDQNSRIVLENNGFKFLFFDNLPNLVIHSIAWGFRSNRIIFVDTSIPKSLDWQPLVTTGELSTLEIQSTDLDFQQKVNNFLLPTEVNS